MEDLIMFWKFVHIKSAYYSMRNETHALLKSVLLHELHCVVKIFNATNLRVIKHYLTRKEPNKSCKLKKLNNPDSKKVYKIFC